MRDVLSIVVLLALIGLAVFTIHQARTRERRRERIRDAESAASARELRDRLGTGHG